MEESMLNLAFEEFKSKRVIHCGSGFDFLKFDVWIEDDNFPTAIDGAVILKFNNATSLIYFEIKLIFTDDGSIKKEEFKWSLTPEQVQFSLNWQEAAFKLFPRLETDYLYQILKKELVEYKKNIIKFVLLSQEIDIRNKVGIQPKV